MTQSTAFALGEFRPLYLWGGKGTARMLRLKFGGAKVDEKMHDYAHSIEGAERVAALGFNWVFLAYNWGFPPEVEEQDWESFASTLQIYQRVGIKVMGYVQSSNCVAEGSYADKDWYARDPYGHRIPYYRGRYFTSLVHAGWLAEVRGRVRRLVELGADGIFFDNPWQGGIGMDLGNMPLGFIGSYDIHSKNAYANAFNGSEIPFVVDTRDPATQQYLRWRAQVAVTAVRDWAQTARDLKSSIVIAANNFDAVVQNSYTCMGMDIEGLAEIQDFIMIENFSLPRVQEDGAVISNAITIGAAQARIAPKPVTTNPYINGIGFDRVWQPRQFSRMLAESAAMNSATVVRGTTFLYRGEYTLLLHKRYEAQHQALSKMNHWLEKHADWLHTRQPLGNLAVYYPYEAARWQWNRIAPYFFAACQTLILNGYPLRIVSDDDAWDGVQVLIVPPGAAEGFEQKLERFTGKVIRVGQGHKVEGALWAKWKPIPHHIPNFPWLRRRINQGAMLSWRAYHASRVVRWASERVGLHLQTTRSPLFFNPPKAYQEELVNAIGQGYQPHLKSEYPALLTGWREPDGTQQWHVVNYADTPQRITLELDQLIKAHLYAVGEDAETAQIVGSALMMTVDVAKVVRVAPN